MAPSRTPPWLGMALLPTVHVSHDEQQPARASSGTWGHWRDAVLSPTSWYHAVMLWVQEGGYSFKWLDETEGCMQLTFPGAIDAAMWSFGSLLQLLYPHLLVIQLLLSEDFSSCELESMSVHRLYKC